MAYQPIEIGRRPPMFDAMDQLGQSLGQLGDDRRQQRVYADAQKRQKGQDYQNALFKAMEALKKRDYEGARAIMGGAGFESSINGGEPLAPQGLPSGVPPEATKVPPAQQQPQGGSAMPPGMRSLAQNTNPADFDTEHGQVPQQQPSPPPNLEALDSLPMGSLLRAGVSMPGMARPGAIPQAPPPEGAPGPGPGPASPAPGPSTNPLFAAAEGTKARDQRRTLTITGPDGNKVTLDPEGADERLKSARMARMDALVEESHDPVMAKYYPRLRPILATADDWHPAEVLRFIHNEEATEHAQTLTDEKTRRQDEAAQSLEAYRRDRLRVTTEGQDKALKGNMAKAGAMGPGNPLKIDTSNRGDSTSLENAVKAHFAMADGKTLLKSDRQLHAAMVNIEAKGPDAVSAHKEAFMALERVFRGGTPTEAEQALLLHNMGGIPGAIDQYLEDFKSGDFSDITKRNLAFATKLSLKEQQENIGNVMDSLKDRLGTDSEFAAMGTNVNSQIRSVGRLYGLNLPDLYPRGGGQSVLGVGTRLANPPKVKPSGPTAPRTAPKSTAEYLDMLK